MNKIFAYKSPNYNKLVSFGFIKDGEWYSYVTEIYNGQFEMRVHISAAHGEVKTELIDLATGEPYTLHLVAEASGTFVGAVRAEYERVLQEISDKCFKKDVFKSDIAHKVIEYVRGKYGDELEYLWQTFPSNAVWRRKDNKKWYGILLLLSKRKLGLDSDEVVDVIDLRIDPEVLPEIMDGERYFAGYHMNKKSWFTMCLDGSVPFEEICTWLDKSYDLAKKG
ncbi:MAG: MmcQ/YjbR family DNA-binding protein [Clostridia bacterium]|nr:MmcQ/YjbR family DNA-binding protein [Clostridia bacterium]